MNSTIKSVLLALLLVLAPPLQAGTPALSDRLAERAGGEFELESSAGRISLQQFRGQVLLIFFGFTSCPDICPIALSVMSRVFNQLDAGERDRVRGLFVTLDPDRDSPELLDKYTGYFHPNITGVTENIDVIRQVASRYGISFERRDVETSPIGYVIDHSPDILVVNRDGRLLSSRIEPRHGVDEIASFVRELLRD